MSIDLINAKGTSWHINNACWATIIKVAIKRGWSPSGTIIYKRVDQVSDLAITKLDNYEIPVAKNEGDVALGFDLFKRSNEVDSKWDGNYFSNDGQIITTSDATNMAEALSLAVQDGVFRDWEEIPELIIMLNDGECMIW